MRLQDPPHISKKTQIQTMTSSKFFYKGQSKDFIIFIESEEAVKSHLKDPSVPLVNVVSNFKVYTTMSGHGAEGKLDEASKQELAIEFGELKVEEIIEKMLKEGSFKHNFKVDKHGFGSTNDNRGSLA